MGNKASKGCPSSSNNSSEPHEGHSSLTIINAQCDEASEYTRVMDPANIRYSQTRISRSFTPSILQNRHNTSTSYMSYAEVRKSAESDLLLDSLLSKLQTGHTTVDAIAPIRVVFYNNSWYSLDNRRLWVFKQFGMPIPVRVITHLDAFLQKFQQDGDNLTATFSLDIRACATIKPRPNDQDRELLEHVFEWSIKDIMDNKFLKNKVNVIPTQFESLMDYFTSFKWPLLEEVRGQIKQSLDLIEKAPYAHLAQISQYKAPKNHSLSKSFEKILVRISQGHLRNRQQKDGTQFRFKPKDLLLLSSNPPGFGGLEFPKAGDMMAFVEKMEDDDGPLRILVHRSHVEDLLDETKTWYAIYLSGLATSCRIWKALNPADMGKPIFGIIKKTFDYHSDQSKIREDETLSTQWLKQSIERYCSTHLNESQTSAVVSTVIDVKTGLNPGVRMIQGPPGTGKTSTVVTLLSVAASSHMKCLVACPTNTAVAEVALRYLGMLEAPGKMQFGEFCKAAGCFDIESSVETAKTFKILEKRDIVLVGNEEKLLLKGQLKEIYLPSRVELIHTANTSWRSVALSLSSFIVSFESIYQEQQTREDADPLKPTGLLGFVRSNLEELIMQLKEHGDTLVQALPIDQAEEFSKTAKLAETLLNSILDPTLHEQDFPEWFSSDESGIELVNQLRKCLMVKHGHLFSKESIEKLCLQSSSVCFCTVSTAGRHCMKDAAPFDCLIIDEAAQLVEAETAIVTCLLGLNHAILFGDHKQLPATVISKVAVESGYGRSLFERMISLKHPCHLLNIQYRMHPSISLFPNTKFYEDRLFNGDNVRGPSYRLHEDLLYGSYAFLDVSDGVEQTGHDGKSKKNSVEAAVVVAIIEKLREVSKRKNIHNLSVGIITPYSSQRDHLRTCLEAQKTEPSLIVDINSVDGFQGQEKDVIIISTVRANKHGTIGFLKDERRLNVAITRARYCLWIVGCSKTLQGERNIWEALVKDAMDREVYKRAANDTGIAKAITKAKKEMNAYSDLLKTGSALFNDMLWKVYFSNDFKTSFPQIKLLEKREKIVSRIRRLSSGRHFSKYKMECVPPTDKLHGLIEVDIAADLCLVWNIDIERDGEAIQIIKIWNIVNRPTLPKLIKRLQAAFNVYSEHYIERCKVRHLSRDKELTIPERWPEDPDFVWLKPHGRHTQVSGSQDQSPQSDSANLENSSVSESLLLMKFYAMSSGIAKNLLTAEDGSEVNLPFQVNKEELLIIQHPSSCFILGRSGTGKTTVLTTKLIQREQQNHISISGLNLSEALPEATNEISIANKEHIRQIFVTLSPWLCSDILQQITQIQRTLSAAVESTSAQHYSNSDYELLLDGDIESKVMGLLPNTFIDVPSKYYPMVLTFRKFLMMLANSVPCPFFKDKTKSSYQRAEIDYDRFDSEYWPHFNANLTKKFDSSTVFTEIISVIKGSVQAVKSDKGVLSKESYCSLNSSTKQFSVPQKKDIYNLFVQYEKLKMETNCYDMADWVKHTYKQLCCGEYRGDKIDFVYIDEVQDFTQAQISLFSFVCTNIKEGYIFAGDTAQTIARGVHFRFQDGRSLFYTDFKESAHTCERDNTSENKEFKAKLFQLRHNFRTHVGVVKLANSIVQLLYHFFPQSIDKLDPETSLVWGQLPALLTGQQEELLKTMHNMGAQQVIIVRDESQKAQLLQQMGKRGLVLTISGCKGLEFEDVLLYNFFSDSAMQDKWKVLYDYPFQTNVPKMADISGKKTYPTFDVNRHHLLCSELKHLYVAVTRARERLWIFEDNNEFCKPMLNYWLGHELIETKILDQSFVFSMKSSSTHEDWRKRGFKLFNRQHYDDAMLCFERAGDEHYIKLSEAASLKQKGEKQLSTNRREAIHKLREAAELFLVLKNTEKAAECYIAIGDLKKAGVLYIENCTPPKFEDAGDCFLEAKSWLEAGEAYFGGRCIKKCLDACSKGKHLEEGLSFIKQWRKEPLIDDFQGTRVGYEEVINEYLQKCAASFHQQHNIMTMMMFVNAFSSIDLKRVFLRGRNYFHELMRTEEAEGNCLQAAEMAELIGDLLHAATLLEKAGDYDNAVKKVLLLILKDALWGEQNTGWPFRKMKRPDELLRRVETLAALAENSVQHEAKLEVQLIFEDVRNPQDVRFLLAHVQTLSSINVKFFTTWKALDAFLRILQEIRQPNRQKLGRAKQRDRNAMLVQTLRLWIDWQNFILHCKKAVLGQESLQKAIPESAQDDIREFCYEFFGVTQGEGSNVCFVHNSQAYWFESHKKGTPPIKISKKEFAKLSTKFWDEQLLGKEEAITEMCHPPTLLLTLLWPQVRKAGEMFDILKLRKATTIVAILDKIADQITSNPKKILHNLEATGRLQLIFPFLSEAWKKKNIGTFTKQPALAFWNRAVTVDWSRNTELSIVEDYVVECGEQLIQVFYSDWINNQEYISPVVFVALLERVIVMACACNTLLDEMFLPMTLAVEVMCSKVQGVPYQNILSSNDLGGRERLNGLIENINKIAFQLLQEPTDMEEWIRHTKGDPNTDLAPLLLRLTTLLFTIFLNWRDSKVKECIIGELRIMFGYQTTKLIGQLPRSYTTECHKACLIISTMSGAGNVDESMKQLKHDFAKALTSIGDSLVMTRWKNASCCKPDQHDIISTIELDGESDLSMELHALASASSETSKVHCNLCKASR